jgi:hypothetical protein
VFFITKSQRAVNLVVSDYELPFEIFKSKIKDLVPITLVDAVAHILLIYVLSELTYMLHLLDERYEMKVTVLCFLQEEKR